MNLMINSILASQTKLKRIVERLHVSIVFHVIIITKAYLHEHLLVFYTKYVSYLISETIGIFRS